MTFPDPDKVTIAAHYDDKGECRQIMVYLNSDYLTPHDVAEAVRAVFKPNAVTNSDPLSGGTRQFPFVGLNGHAINPGPPKPDEEWTQR